MNQNQKLKANHDCGYWRALLPAAPVLFVTWHFWNIPTKSLKLWRSAQNNIELFFSNIVVFLWFVYANNFLAHSLIPLAPVILVGFYMYPHKSLTLAGDLRVAIICLLGRCGLFCGKYPHGAPPLRNGREYKN